ncbi:MAG: septal ring lytic transglycosylase RlpA family protein [Terriglobales bacterium]
MSGVVLLIGALLLTGCGEKKRARTPVPSPPDISQPEPTESASPAHSSPNVAGRVDVAPFPDDAPVLWSETGMASWYGPPYHNRRAANGEVFDMNQMTAAHLTLPLNSYVRVTNVKTEHSVIVRITDRGPFVPNRIIDLSMGAAKAVDVWRPGTAKVRLDVLYTPGSIKDAGRWCVQIGAIKDEETALQLKEDLAEKYKTAKVLEFRSPVGDHWVRVRVDRDDKELAESIAKDTTAPEGNIFLVRLD